MVSSVVDSYEAAGSSAASSPPHAATRDTEVARAKNVLKDFFRVDLISKVLPLGFWLWVGVVVGTEKL